MDDTLSLKEAAKFLKIHPVTLADKARAGEILGAKIGRAWVFIKIDLEEYIRSKYPRRVQLVWGRTTLCICTIKNSIPKIGVILA